jgi:hypothetical protein
LVSGNSVKWIPLEGMELTAADLAPAEKLRKFGFSLVCCSFGSGKLTKAGLCIYDVLAEKETPNILVVTSAREIYGWYRILMTGIGADFKVINGAANEIVFFTGDSSNLYLCPPAALDAANGLKTKVPADFQWDLIIVDDEQSLSAPDCRKLSERIPWKSERLLMFTQFPAQNDDERVALSEFVKSTLAEEANASCADGLDFTVNGVPLGYDTPLLLAGDKHICSGALNVETADYGFDAAFLAGLRRRSDIRTGLPSYKYGGNIFEDYDVEDMKGLYQKSAYTPSDVAELRAVDKKLDCFLNLADKVASDENSRAMIYCCDRNTVDYLRKVLSAMYSESRVKTARSELFSNKDILRKLQVDDSTVYPKFVIAMDDISAVGDGLDRITDVFSYELPDSAVLLERRVTRHGTAHEADRRFVFFRDSNKLFDSRMLGKVLYASLPNAFCGDIPARNVLLDIPAKGEYIAELVADLRYAESYASEVDSCYDLIKKVKADYELLGAGNLSNARHLAEFAGKLLAKVCRFYGIEKDSSPEEIAAAADKLSGLCQAADGALSAVPADMVEKISKSLDADPAAQPFGEEAIAGLEQAKQRVNELHSGSHYHLMIKNDIQSLNDCIQYPVLYNIWKYRVREQDSVRSFRDFIRIYNDGM